MFRFILAWILILPGCAPGIRGDVQPPNLYRTLPMSREYVEIGEVRSSFVAYGLSGRAVRQAALVRLSGRVNEAGHDAAIDVRVRGGCPAGGFLAWTVLAPNCVATATGLAVRWMPDQAESRVRLLIEVGSGE